MIRQRSLRPALSQTLSVGLVAVLLLAAAPSGDRKPESGTEGQAAQFGVKCRKAEDRVQPLVEMDRTIFRITSKSGIGSAEVTLVGGSWPRQMVLRFTEWNGMLEHLSVGGNKLSLSGNLRTRPRTVSFFDANGKPVEDRAKAVYVLTVESKEGGKVVEVVLPPGFGSPETKTLKLSWIDAYR